MLHDESHEAFGVEGSSRTKGEALDTVVRVRVIFVVVVDGLSITEPLSSPVRKAGSERKQEKRPGMRGEERVESRQLWPLVRS